MELTVKSRNSRVTEHQRDHIEAKLGKLERYMDGITSATVELHTEHQRTAGEVHRIQVTLVGKHGVYLRAEEQAPDVIMAVDEVEKVLERQIKRYKEKYWRKGRGRKAEHVSPVEAEPALGAPEVEAGAAPERIVIRTKPHLTTETQP